ncbi:MULTISPECIES: hypothetical protein [unclassified Amycolatopsis]|uniref:hypothetical protein n=1 Tax=unclassified Amycolatopsis TaxID=2618356 RepID=UPI002874DEE5|nr:MULTISPECIES: hypothetical protein [unclassified Amycolatopsis]MDS0134653.1 hypothetical protein [Amycolatopsis sp. 505]MDS0147448.1 hypothetical protein [Amycolatopsis sp. CM201R]
MRTFQAAMRTLGVRPDPAKVVLAAAGERIKRNGWAARSSPPGSPRPSFVWLLYRHR